MKDTYSLYEAKARFSALVRQVRDGGRVIVTVHGRPVAELRAYEAAAEPPSLDQRLADLEDRGILQPAERSPADPAVLRAGGRKAGALRRFLEERE